MRKTITIDEEAGLLTVRIEEMPEVKKENVLVYPLKGNDQITQAWIDNIISMTTSLEVRLKERQKQMQEQINLPNDDKTI